MYRMMLYVLTGLLLAGCGGSKTISTSKNADMPDFVLNPPKENGALFGTGTAELKTLQLAKEIADFRACKEITSALSFKVTMMLKIYLDQAGIGSKSEVKELAKLVDRALTDIELTGVSIEKRELANGKIYSLAKYPLDDSMKKLVNEAISKSLLSNVDLLSQFQEKRGFIELDEQLEKMMASEE